MSAPWSRRSSTICVHWAQTAMWSGRVPSQLSSSGHWFSLRMRKTKNGILLVSAFTSAPSRTSSRTHTEVIDDKRIHKYLAAWFERGGTQAAFLNACLTADLGVSAESIAMRLGYCCSSVTDLRLQLREARSIQMSLARQQCEERCPSPASSTLDLLPQLAADERHQRSLGGRLRLKEGLHNPCCQH